ncbi:hypothetical protein Tco_0426191 [Tanacetum coccineum]
MITMPLEASIMMLANMKHGNDEELQVISLFKVLEAVVKVLLADNGLIRCDRWLEVVRLLLTLFKSEDLVSGQDFGSGIIPVMEWPGGNQIEGVDWKPGRLNFINKRLSERLCEKLGIPKKSTCELHVLDLVSTNVLLFVVESLGSGTGEHAMFEKNLFEKIIRMLFVQATSMKEKVMKWMFKGVKSFTHVILDEYICVILLDDLLIAGKKGFARAGARRGGEALDASRRHEMVSFWGEGLAGRDQVARGVVCWGDWAGLLSFDWCAVMESLHLERFGSDVWLVHVVASITVLGLPFRYLVGGCGCVSCWLHSVELSDGPWHVTCRMSGEWGVHIGRLVRGGVVESSILSFRLLSCAVGFDVKVLSAFSKFQSPMGFMFRPMTSMLGRLARRHVSNVTSALTLLDPPLFLPVTRKWANPTDQRYLEMRFYSIEYMLFKPYRIRFLYADRTQHLGELSCLFKKEGLLSCDKPSCGRLENLLALTRCVVAHCKAEQIFSSKVAVGGKSFYFLMTVRGGNTQTILLPFEEEQAELKIFSKLGLGEKLNISLRRDKRVDTMPTATNPVNATTTINVSQSVVDENLPQLLDSRRGSHVTSVPLTKRILQVGKLVIKCKTAKEMWNDLILVHKVPSNTKDTKIAALRLKFNAFKSLEGEKQENG